MSADVITEIDVLDPERVAALAMVECGQCGHVAEAIDMCQQYSGEYLCPGCDYSAFQDSYPRWSR